MSVAFIVGNLKPRNSYSSSASLLKKCGSIAPFTNTLDFSSLSFGDSVKELKRLICLPPLGITTGPLFPWICWTIWSAWNYRIFEDRSFSPDDTALKAIQDAETAITRAEWVFTTKDGIQIDSGSTAEQYMLSPLMAEAISIRSALIQALEKNFLHLQVKSDAQDLI
ncbi:unnamed protein product [Microthlaspi erraticum]|uniref:RNase H type-1 domain-containing protein n=1 Tax=Microthlaspi erraticum TaxID=1685480 RepID=A0A6D2I271_9BRAS|nr:unnamed protein product [Microthlaspi erraticum]